MLVIRSSSFEHGNFSLWQAIHLFFKKQHPSLPALTTDTVKEKVSRDDGKAEVEVTSLRIMLKKHASKIVST